MSEIGLQGYGTIDLDALDGKHSINRIVGLDEDLDRATRVQLDSLAAAYKSRYRTCRVCVGALLPFNSARLKRGEWSRLRTATLTDRNGDNKYEANFFVTEGVVMHMDLGGIKPLEGHPGFEIQVRAKKIER